MYIGKIELELRKTGLFLIGLNELRGVYHDRPTISAIIIRLRKKPAAMARSFIVHDERQ